MIVKDLLFAVQGQRLAGTTENDPLPQHWPRGRRLHQWLAAPKGRPFGLIIGRSTHQLAEEGYNLPVVIFV